MQPSLEEVAGFEILFLYKSCRRNNLSCVFLSFVSLEIAGNMSKVRMRWYITYQE